jgi:hypothetical protein
LHKSGKIAGLVISTCPFHLNIGFLENSSVRGSTCLDLRGNLNRFQLPLPLMHQLLEHAVRAELQRFSADSKRREIIVSHAHVDFVGLNVVFLGGFATDYGLQFGGGGGCEEFFQDW